jgi:hypothetical protein
VVVRPMPSLGDLKAFDAVESPLSAGLHAGRKYHEDCQPEGSEFDSCLWSQVNPTSNSLAFWFTFGLLVYYGAADMFGGVGPELSDRSRVGDCGIQHASRYLSNPAKPQRFVTNPAPYNRKIG